VSFRSSGEWPANSHASPFQHREDPDELLYGCSTVTCPRSERTVE